MDDFGVAHLINYNTKNKFLPVLSNHWLHASHADKTEGCVDGQHGRCGWGIKAQHTFS